MDFHHIPVLFEPTIESLNIKEDGVYIDCTAGGGGHSAAILSHLKNGRLIAIDRDPDAIQVLTERFGNDERVTVVHDNFFNVKAILDSLSIPGADGILADLGVSSHQLDDASRGFSFHKDAPLDMRMSQEGMTAADAVNNLPFEELRRIISTYGEEKFAHSIAKAIVNARQKAPIQTTLELVDVIRSAMPAAAVRDNHPGRKTFQSLRIFINSEINGLDDAIEDMFSCLNTGGRLSIITFHSIEDRTVKQTFAGFSKGCTCPKDFPVCVCGQKPRAKVMKPVAPNESEVEQNPRSRSAKLRTLKKL